MSMQPTESTKHVQPERGKNKRAIDEGQPPQEKAMLPH